MEIVLIKIIPHMHIKLFVFPMRKRRVKYIGQSYSIRSFIFFYIIHLKNEKEPKIACC